MSEKKHTPGPWTLNSANQVVKHGDQSIIIANPYHGSMPTEANARLIAAAPELLEAAEAVIKQF